MLLVRLFLAISMICAAKPKSATKLETNEDVLKQVAKKYSSQNSIKMEVKKTLVLAMMNRTNVSEGFLALSGKENLRLEFSSPVKSVVIMNGKQMWAIDYPAPGMDDEKIRVTRTKVDKKSEAQVQIASILGKGRILEHFQLTGEDKEGVVEKQRKFLLKPKKESEEISKLAVTVDTKSDEIVQLIWWDKLDNQTRMDFSKVNFKAKLSPGFFNYTPPKNADITDL